MERQPNLTTKQRLFIVFSLIVGALMLSLSMSVLSSGGIPAQRQRDSLRAQQQRDSLPIVESHVESLQFINTQKADFVFTTRMKNTSTKSITAFTVSLCGVPLFARDYTIGNNSIEPGQILEIGVPSQAVSDNCGVATQPVITILAVVFDDRSSEGEVKWVRGILENRRGERLQLIRINHLLAKAANSADADKSEGIARLKSEIAALPVDEGERPAVRGGLISAKDRVLHMIAELEQWHSSGTGTGIQSASNRQTTLRAELAGIKNVREGFAKLVSLNEKWISKY